MKKKTFTLFLLKCILLATPFLALLGLYFYDDPFEVLHVYNRYYNSPVCINESYACWQNYLNHRDSVKYNSFILGNSCTMAFPAREWEKYLSHGRAVRLYGSAERLGSIHQKLLALEASKDTIANVLLLLDYATLKQTQLPKVCTQILHPAISGQRHFEFQMSFLQTFFNPDFWVPYLDYRFFKEYRPYMTGIIAPGHIYRDFVTNDIINPRELEIEKCGKDYWENCKNEFPAHGDVLRVSPPVIMKRQLEILDDIRRIFITHGTNYKILISPKYNQIKLNPDDLKILRHIFGEEHVFDFSGVNEYTENVYHYYEPSHYRPELGEKLLRVMYDGH